MQSIKRHIAFLLLAGFLFPQVAGSLHYFIVDHTFSAEDGLAFTKPEVDYNYHSCIYHLNGFTGFLSCEQFSWKPEDINSPAILNYFSLDNYVHRQGFNFQLRGPPQPGIYSS